MLKYYCTNSTIVILLKCAVLVLSIPLEEKQGRLDGEALENDYQWRKNVQYVIVYIKINEDKVDGLVFNGPFYGPIAKSEDAAKEKARELSNETRSGAVISRIYNLPDDVTFSDAMIKARPQFERIKEDMIEAKGILDRPVIKRKKKRRN